jgi:hypothetical protein
MTEVNRSRAAIPAWVWCLIAAALLGGAVYVVWRSPSSAGNDQNAARLGARSTGAVEETAPRVPATSPTGGG